MSVVICKECDRIIDMDTDTDVYPTKKHEWICFDCLDDNHALILEIEKDVAEELQREMEI